MRKDKREALQQKIKDLEFLQAEEADKARATGDYARLDGLTEDLHRLRKQLDAEPPIIRRGEGD